MTVAECSARLKSVLNRRYVINSGVPQVRRPDQSRDKETLQTEAYRKKRAERKYAKKPDPNDVAVEILPRVCRFIHCRVCIYTAVYVLILVKTATLRYVTTRFIHFRTFCQNCHVSLRYVTLRRVLEAPTEPASLLAAWKDVLTDTSGAEEGEGRARRWEGQVRPKNEVYPHHHALQNILIGQLIGALFNRLAYPGMWTQDIKNPLKSQE